MLMFDAVNLNNMISKHEFSRMFFVFSCLDPSVRLKANKDKSILRNFISWSQSLSLISSSLDS